MIKGFGLHSGKVSSIEILPAKPDSGLVFIQNKKRIKICLDNIISTERGTSLAGISTIEHLLAAFYGLGIFDAEIKIEGNEIPALDGSALPFVKEIRKQNTERRTREPIILKKTIKLDKIEARPYHGFKINFMIEFPVIGRQELSLEVTPESFEREIATARTFGFISEVEALKKKGLAKGASLENALAIGDAGYVNKPRFPDEPVRHKILDLIGDLALLGAPIKAEIFANQSGHKDNIKLVRGILCQR